MTSDQRLLVPQSSAIDYSPLDHLQTTQQDKMRGYFIERNIKLDELPGTLKDCPDPKPDATKGEVLVDVQ